MTRAYTLAVLAIVGVAVLAYASLTRPPAATTEECQVLLYGHTADKAAIRNFIERAEWQLKHSKSGKAPTQTERLGLCTGALMIKAESIK